VLFQGQQGITVKCLTKALDQKILLNIVAADKFIAATREGHYSGIRAGDPASLWGNLVKEKSATGN
jgi:hypothetical protein